MSERPFTHAAGGWADADVEFRARPNLVCWITVAPSLTLRALQKSTMSHMVDLWSG